MSYEQRVLRRLQTFLRQEERDLTQAKWLGYILGLLGWVSVFVSILQALKPRISIPIIAALGIIGGVCIGLSILFHTFHRQWPVMRRFMDIPAIKAASPDAL